MAFETKGALERVLHQIAGDFFAAPESERAAWLDLVVSGFASPDQQGVPSHESFPRDELERVMDVDFWGVVNGTKVFLPYLIESGDGHVVNISSLFGIFSVPGQAVNRHCAGSLTAVANAAAQIGSAANIPTAAYLHGTDPSDQVISVIDADLASFPPTFVAWGGDEMFRDPIRRFVERGGRWLALHGTNCTLDPPTDSTGGLYSAPRVVPVWADTLGSQFLSHPPIEPYVVNRSPGAAADPLVAGIESFEANDELYLMEHHGDLIPLLETSWTGTTRGFAELVRFGTAFGAKAGTMMGLSGLGEPTTNVHMAVCPGFGWGSS